MCAQTGTIGGSVANNDPNADYPAACLGLGATIVTNKRKIAADDYFKGMFDTALEPDEIITEITLPDRQEGGLSEVQAPGLGLRAGRRVRVQALVGNPRGRDRRRIERRVPRHRFRGGAEEALRAEIARRRDASRADGINSDIHGSAEYRAHLVGVMARRAVAAANERGGEDD